MFSTNIAGYNGSLGYSGPPFNAAGSGSDAYMCWSLIGAYNYYIYTGDVDFIRTVWSNYTEAMAFLSGQQDSTGLVNVIEKFANDWGREGAGGHNSATNALFYKASELNSFDIIHS